MSALSTPLPQQASLAGKIAADLDQLFSEQGLAINGDGDSLLLRVAPHHSRKHSPSGPLGTPPENPKKPHPPYVLKAVNTRPSAMTPCCVSSRTLRRFLRGKSNCTCPTAWR